jgi:uncharacterized protein YkwD
MVSQHSEESSSTPSTHNNDEDHSDQPAASSLPSVSQTARQFCKHLLQAETWQEVAQHSPRRAKVSLVLVLVLVGIVLWLQAKITPSPSTSQPIAGAPSAATPKPNPLQAVLKPPATLFAKLISVRSSTQLVSEVTATPTPSQRPAATPTPFFTIHTVKHGETLIAIAAKYNVTTEELLAANDIRDPTSLEAGRELLIPPDDKLYQGEIILHEIKKGDTLLSIASKYGSSVKAIEVANPHLEFDKLSPGETIAVPAIFSELNPVDVVEAPAEATYHIVERGDIPLTIAAEYDIPVEILLTVNNITDPTLLQVGQKLVIPPHDGISLGFPVILYELTETDTLVGIASRFGSSVKDILAVNPDLDPGALEAGQLVAIPVIFAPPRPTPAPEAPRPTPGPPPPALVNLEQQVIAAVNAQREQQELSAYLPDEELTAVALAHAQDMYVRDFFAHVSPDGQTLSDRLAEAGVNFASAGENIQRNTQPADQTAQVAVNWFMNSAPHRHNILHNQHNRIGVAVVEGPPGWFTFVLVFAQR